jgi:argininosuccinate lyase
MNLEVLAAKAVQYLALQILGGALEKLGADAKDYLQNLTGLLSTKFFGREELQQGTENPAALEALVKEEASKDITFRRELEHIVGELVAIEESKSSSVSQVSTGSGANIHMGTNSGSVIGTQNVDNSQYNFR